MNQPRKDKQTYQDYNYSSARIEERPHTPHKYASHARNDLMYVTLSDIDATQPLVTGHTPPHSWSPLTSSTFILTGHSRRCG